LSGLSREMKMEPMFDNLRNFRYSSFVFDLEMAEEDHTVDFEGWEISYRYRRESYEKYAVIFNLFIIYALNKKTHKVAGRVTQDRLQKKLREIYQPKRFSTPDIVVKITIDEQLAEEIKRDDD
jgi:hypothetical protein